MIPDTREPKLNRRQYAMVTAVAVLVIVGILGIIAGGVMVAIRAML